MNGKADPRTAGEGTTSRARLDRGRGALGPALELVHTGRAPTRAVLTAELGVTRATAGAVAAELEALGLIRVDARPTAAAGSQGRPSHRLAVAEPDGLALNPLHLAWPAGAPVRRIFDECVRAAGITGPAFAGNDVNLAALAEHRHGAGRGARDLLCVATGHRGVGGALVLDG